MSTNIFDSLFSFITGMGTAKDPTTSLQYKLNLLTRQDVENAYRGDWVARKIVDAPAEDATREWRDWQAEPEALEDIKAAEKALNLQEKTKQALIRSRLYGGAALVFGIKGQDPATELDLKSVGKGDIEFVVVMNRYELFAGPRIFNVESPYYTQPEYYTVATPVFGIERGKQAGLTAPMNGSYRPGPAKPQLGGSAQTVPAAGMAMVHPSRIVVFTGNDLPDWRLIPMGGGWGDSILQTVDDVLKDIGMVVGGIANMINDAKIDVVKIPDFSKQIATTEYANRVLSRFSFANQAKSAVNSLLLDKEEEWERIQTRFQGLPNMLHEYLVLAGGAADIPMSRLIGQTGGRGMDGGGMSSGGNGGANVDLRNYYDRIAAKQKTVYSPAMALLDECVVRHALGKYDDSIVYDWSPLWQLDESGKAALAAAKANVAKTDIEMGLINEDVLREGRVQQLLDDNFYPGFQDALDKFGAEPPEPDIQVAWSRLAGAMAQSTQEAMPKQLAGPGGASPQDKPPAAAPPEPADPMPGLMKRLGVEPKVPNIRVTQNQDAEPVDVNDRMVTKAEANYRQTGGPERCGNCSMFEAPDRCTLVEGMILPEDVCDYWEQD